MRNGKCVAVQVAVAFKMPSTVDIKGSLETGCYHTKHTPCVYLYFQLELIQSIVAEVNKKTGEAECQFYRRGLSYLEESQRLPEIQRSRFLYCHGELKNNKGQVAALCCYVQLL